MDTYTSCCLALSALNDEGIPAQFQCKLNAAVSGYVLSLLAGEPAYFGDMNMVDTRDGVARLINCGSIPGRLASADQEIQSVEQYAYMGLGRGASTLFCMKSGRITFGTLGRVDGRYVMSIAGGEAFSQPLRCV